uniref:YqgF/RNase H-like domain-containing protein n=1 Tax=Rhizochromulina marina TaxID=1034831 RepID=A0A7S2RUF6_9STRA|mmetsp:Transcript_20692/g.60469  ORF Transcript_20692/g.60469 Transcript_20692/m.60469 type:complete len:179 (+) Transcript_20692:73-609(+)
MVSRVFTPIELVAEKAAAHVRARHPASLLCLDVGTRNIGVAVSDSIFRRSRPLGIIRRVPPVHSRPSMDRVAEQIRVVAHKHASFAVVVGWPVQLDGRPGDQCMEVHRFVTALVAPGRLTLPVSFVDERLSTVDALRHLGAHTPRSRSRKKALRDPMSAVIILARLLESLEFRRYFGP